MIDKDSYNKYGGAVQEGLDMSKQTWGQLDNIGGSLESGDYKGAANAAQTASGMYLPQLPFNQQQLLI